MPVRLRREEVVAIGVMADTGEAKTRIARRLGVTEGTVRYHLRRRAEGTEDGRRDKPFRAASQAEVIEAWIEAHRGVPRPANLKALYGHLIEDHGYEGSYKSVVRYVRSRWGRPPIRT
jgi:transposase